MLISFCDIFILYVSPILHLNQNQNVHLWFTKLIFTTTPLCELKEKVRMDNNFTSPCLPDIGIVCGWFNTIFCSVHSIVCSVHSIVHNVVNSTSFRGQLLWSTFAKTKFTSFKIVGIARTATVIKLLTIPTTLDIFPPGYISLALFSWWSIGSADSCKL